MDWFDDASFWEDSFPFLFNEQRLSAAPDEVEHILELAGLSSGSVLDLCCGPGRHAIELAQRGFQVTGVDSMAYNLDRAKQAAEVAQAHVAWVLSDMRRFERPEAFDLALNLFTSFGFFEDPRDNLSVLEQVHHNLRPGGCLIMELVGREVLAGNFLPARVDEDDSGTRLVQSVSIIDDWTRVDNRWLLIQDGQVREHRFKLHLYSGQQLRDMLQQAGFQQVTLFGDLAGEPYDADARRLVARAVKSG